MPKAKTLQETKPRTLADINTEYSQLAAQLGDLLFKRDVSYQTEKEIARKMNALNEEAKTYAKKHFEESEDTCQKVKK